MLARGATAAKILAVVSVMEDAMLGDRAIPLYLVAGVVVALAIGSTFTPVISRGESKPPNAIEVANGVQEFTYCQAELSDVNCACFAGISGHILSQEEAAFRGTVSVNRSDLARAQASQSC